MGREQILSLSRGYLWEVLLKERDEHGLPVGRRKPKGATKGLPRREQLRRWLVSRGWPEHRIGPEVDRLLAAEPKNKKSIRSRFPRGRSS